MEETELCIEDLIRIYKEDPYRKDIRNQVVMESKKLIVQAIKYNNSYIPMYHDYEEVMQEGYVKLIEAIERFIPDLGYKFSTYARYYLKGIGKERLDYNKNISLDKICESSDDYKYSLVERIADENVNVENQAIKKIYKKDILKKVHIILNEEEKTVLSLYFRNGNSLKQIAKKINRSYSKTRTIYRIAKEKLQEDPFFVGLKKEMIYITGRDYSRIKINKTNKISDPTSNFVINKIQKEEKYYRFIFQNKLNLN